MLLALLLSNPVMAGDYIQSFEDPIELPLAGGWPRVIPDDDGVNWHLLWAMGGQYSMIPMTSDLWAEDYGRKDLTDGTVSHMLKDHAFTACPDGGYLHIASANVISPNDSAYAFRYDDNFDLVSWSTLEEGVDSQAHNDMPLACSPIFTATSFGGIGVGATIASRYFYLDENAQVVDTQDTVNLPRTGGSALKVEPETNSILLVEMSSLPLDVPGEMWITRLDLDLNLLNVYRAQVLPDGHNGHWPQGILRIGDFYMVAYIGWPDDTWDGHNGDMWVAVFDMDWNLLETQQVSNNTPTNPGMRPGLVRRGAIVLATYDKNTTPHIHELQIDLEAFGIEEGDTGNWDTGDTGGDSDKGCGSCTTQGSPHSGWLGLAALLALLRRRYSDSSS